MNTFQTLVDEINNALAANLQKQPNLKDTEWNAQAKSFDSLVSSELTSQVDKHFFPLVVNEVLRRLFPNETITFTHDKNNSYRLYFYGDTDLKKFGFNIPSHNNRVSGYHFPILFSVKKCKGFFAGGLRNEAALIIKELLIDRSDLLSLSPSEFMLQEAKKYNEKQNQALDRNTLAINNFNSKLSELGISIEAFEELKKLENCILK
jgi:hypothetical protein